MDYTPKKVMVKRAKSGLGLFSGEDLKKGQFIIEYTGEHISHEEADLRGGMYLFTINEKIVIDGKTRDNIARYINHSCNPNAEAESDDEDEKIRVYAKKRIALGDEITIDYGKEHWENYIGHENCRCNKCEH
jgi:SET domain-containing protein